MEGSASDQFSVKANKKHELKELETAYSFKFVIWRTYLKKDHGHIGPSKCKALKRSHMTTVRWAHIISWHTDNISIFDFLLWGLGGLIQASK